MPLEPAFVIRQWLVHFLFVHIISSLKKTCTGKSTLEIRSIQFYETLD